LNRIVRPKGSVEKLKTGCTSLLVRFFSKIKQLIHNDILITKIAKASFCTPKTTFSTAPKGCGYMPEASICKNSMKKVKIKSINNYVKLIEGECSALTKRITPIKKMRIARKLFFWILIPLLLSRVAFSEEKRIAIVKSSDSPSFQAATEGVKKELRKGEIQPVFIEYDLSSDFSDESPIVGKIRELQPDLIVTVGSKSTALVSKEIKDIPIVFSAVLNPISSGFAQSMESSRSNLTGASLDIPLKTQLEKFKLIVPGLKKVGVIFTRDSAPVVADAKRICKDMGLELVSVSISSEKEMPGVIENLGQRVDGLWGVADTIIFTPQSTQYLLLYTLRHGIPFMGPFPSFVKAGALFTLAWDDKDVGRQSGELAIRILAGESPNQISLTTPRMIYLILNLRTAEQINLKIPPHIVSVAKEVYR
jgi:putative ABC transport system substrate-binding protein